MLNNRFLAVVFRYLLCRDFRFLLIFRIIITATDSPPRFKSRVVTKIFHSVVLLYGMAFM